MKTNTMKTMKANIMTIMKIFIMKATTKTIVIKLKNITM